MNNGAPSGCTIRLAVQDDVALFAAIDRSTDRQFADAGHPELVGGDSIPPDVARRAVDGRRILVAEIDSTVVGFVYLTRSDGELCVGQISVHASRQQSGVGSALLGHVIAAARQDGEATIVLDTQVDVAWNHPWYERFGFAVVPIDEWTPDMHVIADEQANSGLDWRTRVHMRLHLDGRC